jgi:hypothetical protein
MRVAYRNIASGLSLLCILPLAACGSGGRNSGIADMSSTTGSLPSAGPSVIGGIATNNAGREMEARVPTRNIARSNMAAPAPPSIGTGKPSAARSFQGSRTRPATNIAVLTRTRSTGANRRRSRTPLPAAPTRESGAASAKRARAVAPPRFSVFACPVLPSSPMPSLHPSWRLARRCFSGRCSPF